MGWGFDNKCISDVCRVLTMLLSNAQVNHNLTISVMRGAGPSIALGGEGGNLTQMFKQIQWAYCAINF